jgi:hypothetical protein
MSNCSNCSNCRTRSTSNNQLGLRPAWGLCWAEVTFARYVQVQVDAVQAEDIHHEALSLSVSFFAATPCMRVHR